MQAQKPMEADGRIRADDHRIGGCKRLFTFAEQGAESERLGHAPVDALARLNHLPPLVVHAHNTLVKVEAFRHLGDRVAHLHAHA